MAQASAVGWVVRVQPCVHQIPAAERVVVSVPARGQALATVSVCGVGAHAQRVASQYDGTEPGAVGVTVATLCWGTAYLLGPAPAPWATPAIGEFGTPYCRANTLGPGHGGPTR